MKTTPQNQLLLDKIYQTCCQINNDTDMCAFFWINGHVGRVDVRVTKSKSQFNETIHSDDPHYADRGNVGWNIEKELTYTLNKLYQLLAEHPQTAVAA